MNHFIGARVRFFKLMSRLCFVILISLLAVAPAIAVDSADENNSQVIKQFVEKDTVESDILVIKDQQKRLIMFSLGVPLLVFILITGVLGVAMGVYGKQVFVAHMVFAGLSITLAIAHAVVGVVWFYPF